MNQEQRRLAREKNFYLWRCVIDGSERRPQSGRFEIWGPMHPDCAAELKALIDRWLAEGKV